MSSVLYSCAICLQQWPDSQALGSLKCGHTFCKSCIQRHINNNSNRAICPTCRASPVEPGHVRPVFVDVDASDPTTRENARMHQRAITALENEVDRLQLEVNGLRRDDRYSTQRIKELEADIKERSRTIGQLKHARDDLKKEKRRLALEGKQLGDDLATTRERLSRTEEDLQRSRGKLSQTEEDLGRSREALRRAQAEEALRRSREEAVKKARYRTPNAASDVVLPILAWSARTADLTAYYPSVLIPPQVARSEGGSRTKQRRATDWM
ncbi:hypothetical protein PENSPDRAFT_665094 [Peniophora sp. CONT]|nr:hypothetical protein PENSPDRAFT_665094 [Peniophora sp. CONT]